MHYLVKGRQPIIIALARGLKEKLEPELQKSLDDNRLLIITPFEKQIKRVTEQTAAVRNKMMIEIADNVVIGFCSKGGQLGEILRDVKKPIKYLIDPL